MRPPFIPGIDAEPLDRFLARRLRWPWSAVRIAIHQGRIDVGGEPCQQYRRRLTPAERGAVTCDGVAVPDGPDDATLLCHKPAGVACSHAPEDAPLIYDLVPPQWRHPDLQTAGRLDRDTTGLIALSIEGWLIQALTAPTVARWKRYDLTWAGRLAPDAVARVRDGVVIDDEQGGPPIRVLPARLEPGPSDGRRGSATLWLSEGRHHQVKRMMRALGAEVVTLHRGAIGGCELPVDLSAGQMRPISALELTDVLRSSTVGVTPA